MNLNMLKWGRQLIDMDKEERVLALESLRATAEDLLPYDPADIYASTSTPILPHLLLLLMVKLECIHIYIYIYTSENTAAKKDFQWCHIQTSA